MTARHHLSVIMTFFVKPTAQLELEHRAFLFSSAVRQSLFVIASEKGSLTVIGTGLTPVLTFNCPQKLQSVSIHPSLPLLAIIEGSDNHLNFISLDNSSVNDAQSPIFDEVNDPNDDFSGACFFDLSGRYLWYAFARSQDEIEIQLLECVTWRVISKILIQDEYGLSHLSFHATTHFNHVTLWMAAGQDGQQIYWLKTDGRDIFCEIEPELEDTTPPAFSPDGTEFITIVGSETLKRYHFPDVRPLSEFQATGSDIADYFGYKPCYLNQTTILVNFQKCRLSLLNTSRMTLSEEISIEGHEPKPTSVYYPGLKDDDICTDIWACERFGDYIVFIFCRDQSYLTSNWKDTLLFLPISTLLN